MRKYCAQVILENFFEPCILYLLLKKPNYGYELSKNLKDRCECDVNIGNLYRGLNRLVKEGYITKKKKKSNIGPTKIVYTITESGKNYLRTWIESLKKQKDTINKLITNYHHYYETSH